MTLRQSFHLLLPLIILGLTACSKKKTDDDSNSAISFDSQEVAQQIGDVMASIDESYQGNGSYSRIMNSEMQLFARRAPAAIPTRSPLLEAVLPSATAVSCSSVGYDSCDSSTGIAVRNFNNCTVGSATFSGEVTLSYRDASNQPKSTCTLTATAESFKRAPNFTVTGLRGAELTVTKSGSSGFSVFKNVNNTYNIDNDGIRRVFKFNGVTLIDATTTIGNDSQGQPMAVRNAAARNGRTLDDGKVTITDNLTGKTCGYEPDSVTWTASCNCPTSGSWSGSCSDGSSGSMNITGCGSATITVDGESKDVTLDRCYE